MSFGIAGIDIPVQDLDRAIAFYKAVLNAWVRKVGKGPRARGLIPTPEGGELGSLVRDRDRSPCPGGIRPWFDVDDHLEDALDLVDTLGGKILHGPRSIATGGVIAQVQDSEGNVVVLYSHRRLA